MPDDVDDIVFTCPRKPYAFDETLYKKQGMGASEIALIEIARLLKKKTKRRVRVFSQAPTTTIGESGVEWMSDSEQSDYFSRAKPFVHIAWRHNNRLTYAKTYLWSQDLLTETVETGRNFDFLMCLSNFHKGFVHRSQFVPSRKILVTRNAPWPTRSRTPSKGARRSCWNIAASPTGMSRPMRRPPFAWCARECGSGRALIWKNTAGVRSPTSGSDSCNWRDAKAHSVIASGGRTNAPHLP